MAEFRISRKALMATFPQPCKEGVELFDQIAAEQGHGEPDLIFPDGWTELHSVYMYQMYPGFQVWLMRRRLIPADRVFTRFPTIAYKDTFRDYPKDV